MIHGVVYTIKTTQGKHLLEEPENRSQLLLDCEILQCLVSEKSRNSKNELYHYHIFNGIKGLWIIKKAQTGTALAGKTAETNTTLGAIFTMPL